MRLVQRPHWDNRSTGFGCDAGSAERYTQGQLCCFPKGVPRLPKAAGSRPSLSCGRLLQRKKASPPRAVGILPSVFPCPHKVLSFGNCSLQNVSNGTNAHQSAWSCNQQSAPHLCQPGTQRLQALPWTQSADRDTTVTMPHHSLLLAAFQSSPEGAGLLRIDCWRDISYSSQGKGDWPS